MVHKMTANIRNASVNRLYDWGFTAIIMAREMTKTHERSVKNMQYQKPLIGMKAYAAGCQIRPFSMHFHSEFDIVYCVKGDVSVMMESTHYRLTDGCVLFINSMEQHDFKPNDPDSETFFLEFGAALLGEDYYELTKRKIVEPLVNLNAPELSTALKKMKDLLLSAYAELQQGRKDSEWIIKARLYEIASILYREIPTVPNENPELEKRIESYKKIQNVFDWVDREYQKPLTLAQAADRVGYEVKGFCRLFKRTTGTTFHEYLTQYRIRIAAELLIHNRCSVSEVAGMVGIPVTKTFLQNFKKIVGVNTTEYRKRFKPDYRDGE